MELVYFGEHGPSAPLVYFGEHGPSAPLFTPMVVVKQLVIYTVVLYLDI